MTDLKYKIIRIPSFICNFAVSELYLEFELKYLLIMATIEELKNRILNGGEISFEETVALSETEDIEALFEAAGEITRHFGKPAFNPCSIINARAGKCSENCKWCAQSGHYHTDSDVYGIISAAKAVLQARHDECKGVKRFCQVTWPFSQRRSPEKALRELSRTEEKHQSFPLWIARSSRPGRTATTLGCGDAPLPLQS